MLYLRNMACDHDFYCTCVKSWYLQVFSFFFLDFSFSGCNGGHRAKNIPKWKTKQKKNNYIHNTPEIGGKRAKNVQNEKKLCLLCFISQEPYIIRLSFVVRNCKIIISPWIFFLFSKFWFSGVLGGSNSKKWHKMTKTLCLLCLISQDVYIIRSLLLVHMCKRIISPYCFHIFSKF